MTAKKWLLLIIIFTGGQQTTSISYWVTYGDSKRDLSRSYYKLFEDCVREDPEECSLDCVFKRWGGEAVLEELTWANIIKYFNTTLRLFKVHENVDGTVMPEPPWYSQMVRLNYYRCRTKASKIDSNQKCLKNAEFHHCLNDPRNTIERVRDWVFYEGPSGMYEGPPKNGEHYQEFLKHRFECTNEVWTNYRAILYDPRLNDMCTMACVFKRYRIFDNKTINKDNYRSFRKKVFSAEYMVYMDHFYTIDRCLEMAMMYKDECWAAMTLDLCADRYVPVIN